MCEIRFCNAEGSDHRHASFRQSTLTKEQIFRLWSCAIKDDDALVDEVVLHAYKNIIAFDRKRAEWVIQIIIRRRATAVGVFRRLLKEAYEASQSSVKIAQSP